MARYRPSSVAWVVKTIEQCGKALDVQPVRQKHIRVSAKQVSALHGGDVGNGRKDVAAVRRSTFNAVLELDVEVVRFVCGVEE